MVNFRKGFDLLLLILQEYIYKKKNITVILLLKSLKLFLKKLQNNYF